MKINTSHISFIDMSDSRRLEVHITANHPTIQIYNSNNQTFIPNRQKSPLQLSAEVFVDSNTEVTENAEIIWYKDDNRLEGETLSINSNILSESTEETYVCKVAYSNLSAQAQITFTRVDAEIEGLEAKFIKLQSDTQIIKTNKNGKIIPETIVVTPTFQGLTANDYSWLFKIDGQEDFAITPPDGVEIKNESDLSYVEVTSADLLASSLTIKAYHSNAVYDVFTIHKISDGVSYYTWVKYADDVNGTGITDNPEGKKYIGLAYNKIEEIESANPQDYTWSLIQGEAGVTGADGKTYYTWIRYANNELGEGMSDSPQGKSYIGIAYGKTTPDESNNPSDYDWAQFRGSDGIDGESAPIAFLTNENVSFVANANGEVFGTSITTNVVAYKGDEKITPTIGDIADVPTGMVVSCGGVKNNEIPITIKIEDKATLGSETNCEGVIYIPIISPINTSLQLTWSKVNSGKDGAGAITVFLTNENITFAANANGQITEDTVFTTEVVAYAGMEAVNVVIDTNNMKLNDNIKASVKNATITFSIAANSTLGSNNSTNGIIEIPITSPISSTLYLTWSKVNSGIGGTLPKKITLSTDSHIFKADSKGGVIPSTITITPSIQGFTNEEFKWRFMTNGGTTWTSYPPAIKGGELTDEYCYEVTDKGLYTSCIPVEQWNQTSFTVEALTPLTIDCEKLLSYGCSSLSIKLADDDIYDVLTIHRVSDGEKGDDAVTFQIYAPQGTVLQADLETLTLETFAYIGAEPITDDATYQWFKVDDNGVWSKVGEGASYVVNKADVTGSQVYKCVMTYKEREYQETIDILDKNDIFSVKIIPYSGVSIQAGEPGLILSAHIYKNGVDVQDMRGSIVADVLEVASSPEPEPEPEPEPSGDKQEVAVGWRLPYSLSKGVMVVQTLVKTAYISVNDVSERCVYQQRSNQGASTSPSDTYNTIKIPNGAVKVELQCTNTITSLDNFICELYTSVNGVCNHIKTLTPVKPSNTIVTFTIDDTSATHMGICVPSSAGDVTISFIMNSSDVATVNEAEIISEEYDDCVYYVNTDANTVAYGNVTSEGFLAKSYISSYDYTWNITDSDTQISSYCGPVVYISKDSIHKSTVIQCVVREKANNEISEYELCSDQIAVFDINDPIISNTAPSNCIEGMIWIDTSGETQIMKICVKTVEGFEWKPVNSNVHNMFTSVPNVLLSDGYYYHRGDAWILTEEAINDTYLKQKVSNILWRNGVLSKGIITNNINFRIPYRTLIHARPNLCQYTNDLGQTNKLSQYAIYIPDGAIKVELQCANKITSLDNFICELYTSVNGVCNHIKTLTPVKQSNTIVTFTIDNTSATHMGICVPTSAGDVMISFIMKNNYQPGMTLIANNDQTSGFDINDWTLETSVNSWYENKDYLATMKSCWSFHRDSGMTITSSTSESETLSYININGGKITFYTKESATSQAKEAAYMSNGKLNIPEAEIDSINITQHFRFGNFCIIQEVNGSISIVPA